MAWLPDGKRLHLRNGPIDLIIQGFGQPAEVGRAYDAGIERARALVLELAEDVPAMQQGQEAQSDVGLRAAAASEAVPGGLPAVVALNGAVADEVIAAMTQGGRIDRGFANNRGMVAFHVTEGCGLTPVAMDWPEYQRYDARIPIVAAMRSRGMAFAGWRCDGFALGWVERVFAAARTAAVAEAACASISACMRPAAGVEMVPADTLAPLTVLGGLPVCRALPLPGAAEAEALVAQGRARAEALVADDTVVLTAIELGAANCLAGPPHFSLKSLLSLEANF